MKKIIISLVILGLIILTGCSKEPVDITMFLINQTQQLEADNKEVNKQLTGCTNSLKALNKTYTHTKEQFVELKELKLDTAKVTIKTNSSGCSGYIETIKRLEKDRNESHWMDVSDNYTACSRELTNCTARLDIVKGAVD